MIDRPLNVLQVNTSDTMGGAARVATDLARIYRSRGHAAWLAVGQKRGEDPSVFAIPEGPRGPGLIRAIGKAVEFQLGVEDFRFPGTARLLDLPPAPPDVVHCHNLHGGYFDLRVLSRLSQLLPVILTLHDAWLLSGHCAHSVGCGRWRSGCGSCPDLSLYPAVRRDATAYNWRRKRSIFMASSLFVAAPSHWLMRKVEESMLGRAVRDTRVIPNGVDLSVFRRADQRSARAELGIPAEQSVVLFTAQEMRTSVWKDFETVRAAIGIAADRLPEGDLLFIALGDDGPSERVGGARMEWVPYQHDPNIVARYYQAADAYVHAARADTFPTSVLEAMACGTPVVATAVGGIPEQVEDGETGFLVDPGDHQALASHLVRLLMDGPLRRRMSIRAESVAHRRFDLERQADTYLSWYHELLHGPVSAAPGRGT